MFESFLNLSARVLEAGMGWVSPPSQRGADFLGVQLLVNVLCYEGINGEDSIC